MTSYGLFLPYFPEVNFPLVHILLVIFIKWATESRASLHEILSIVRIKDNVSSNCFQWDKTYKDWEKWDALIPIYWWRTEAQTGEMICWSSQSQPVAKTGNAAKSSPLSMRLPVMSIHSLFLYSFSWASTTAQLSFPKLAPNLHP